VHFFKKNIIKHHRVEDRTNSDLSIESHIEGRLEIMEKTLTIKFDQDSKRYHRFKVVDAEGEITGTVYFPKSMDPLPKKLVLEMKSDS